MRSIVAGLLLWAGTGGLVLAADVEVQPGSVVRWPGIGIESCSIENIQYEPIDNVCWYAIDLLRESGPLTLERRCQTGNESRTVTVTAYPYPEQRLQVPETTVHLSEVDEERAAAETQRIDVVWRQHNEERFQFPLAQPIAGAQEGRSFGARRILNGEARSPHSGVDFRASRGTPVVSVAAGVVVLAEDHFFGGKSVFIDHGCELVSMYMHFDNIEVVEGQIVDRGERIGVVGSTGRATGPHLHFGLRWHGARIDPKYLFASSQIVLE